MHQSEILENRADRCLVELSVGTLVGAQECTIEGVAVGLSVGDPAGAGLGDAVGISFYSNLTIFHQANPNFGTKVSSSRVIWKCRYRGYG